METGALKSVKNVLELDGNSINLGRRLTDKLGLKDKGLITHPDHITGDYLQCEKSDLVALLIEGQRENHALEEKLAKAKSDDVNLNETKKQRNESAIVNTLCVLLVGVGMCVGGMAFKSCVNTSKAEKFKV